MATGIARGWPSGVPGSSGQWPHPLAAGGLGEADGVAGGDDDVGVVHEPVDGGVGDGFGHEFVEAGGVQVGGQGDGAFLVGGVDDAVERFGGVGGDREETDVVDLCRRRHRSIYAEAGTMPTSSAGVLAELVGHGRLLVICLA